MNSGIMSDKIKIRDNEQASERAAELYHLACESIELDNDDPYEQFAAHETKQFYDFHIETLDKIKYSLPAIPALAQALASECGAEYTSEGITKADSWDRADLGALCAEFQTMKKALIIKTESGEYKERSFHLPSEKVYFIFYHAALSLLQKKQNNIGAIFAALSSSYADILPQAVKFIKWENKAPKREYKRQAPAVTQAAIDKAEYLKKQIESSLEFSERELKALAQDRDFMRKLAIYNYHKKVISEKKRAARAIRSEVTRKRNRLTIKSENN